MQAYTLQSATRPVKATSIARFVQNFLPRTSQGLWAPRWPGSFDPACSQSLWQPSGKVRQQATCNDHEALGKRRLQALLSKWDTSHVRPANNDRGCSDKGRSTSLALGLRYRDCPNLNPEPRSCSRRHLTHAMAKFVALFSFKVSRNHGKLKPMLASTWPCPNLAAQTGPAAAGRGHRSSMQACPMLLAMNPPVQLAMQLAARADKERSTSFTSPASRSFRELLHAQ